jgi:MoaA/NifB/PqqE/SkfB family radical SAM enzyme
MTEFISPRSKLFGHLDHLVALRDGKYLAPINVEIDLSNRCDLKCAGCHFAYTHVRGPWTGKQDKPDGYIPGGDLMNTKLAGDILFQLAHVGVKSVTWTGGGEPTLHPDFDFIAEIAAFCNLEQGIYSHGGHIKGERAAWMKEHFKWIYFSFDAYDVESYKLHKGVNRFDKVCANIRNVVSLPGAATIGMGFLLTRDNYRHIYAMQKLARDLGVTYAQFRPLIDFAPNEPNVLLEDTSWIDEAVGLLQQYGDDPFIIADIGRFEMYRDWKGHPYKTCRWSALQTVITPNGKVWRCTNKREYPDGFLGDLSVESFETIWERSGGVCQVNDKCRLLCRGAIANVTLDAIYKEGPHANFI